MVRSIEHLTQTQLSKLIESTQHVTFPVSRLSRIEHGLIECRDADVRRIAAALEYPDTFFIGDCGDFSPMELTYRRTSKTKVSEVNAVVGEYMMLAEAVETATTKIGMNHYPSWINQLAPHKKGVLSIRQIERIAQAARLHLGIEPNGPVRNVTRAIERAGIIIVPLHSMGERSTYAQTSEGVTAPKRTESNPIIGYIRQTVPGDRMRFTKAHELGHIILHMHDRDLTKKQMEEEAHNFAGAFIISEDDMRSAIQENTMLTQYVDIKAGWGISISALVMRASTLGIISPDRKRSLQMQIGARGWRKQEPVAVELESPILFKQILGKAYGHVDSPTRSTIDSFKAERELKAPFRFLDFWADGLESSGEEIAIYERRFSRELP